MLSRSVQAGSSPPRHDQSVHPSTASAASAITALAKDWVDVRYTVNGGETQTVRMHQDDTGSRYTASGLKRGDVIEYRVTYWDRARQMAVDLAPKTVVMK